MDRSELREKLITDMKSNPPASFSHFTQWCKKYNYVDLIKDHTSYLPDKCIFTERLYHIFYNLTEKPRCKFCDVKRVNFRNLKLGYRDYCSTKCLNNDPNIRKKIEQTNLIKFGVVCNLTCTDTKQKIKETNIKRFGVEHHSQSDIIKEKKKQAYLRSYGVEHPWQSTEVQKKIEEQSLKKYGTRRPQQSKEVREKMRRTELMNHITRLQKSGKFNDHYEILVDVETYVGVKSAKGELIYYNIRCKKCDNIFKDHIANGRIPRCSKCYPFNISTDENRVAKFCQNYYPNLLINDSSIITPKRLDIYIPDINLGIEYNGLYWHSEVIGRKDKHYHQNKTKMCLQRGIDLIHIFEDEWINKRSIVESILLNKFDKIQDRIYARKCKLTKVNNKVAKDFYNNNHISESVNGTTIGLAYDDQLVSIITVGKSRFKSNYDLEIYRFCSKLNTVVVGGFSKLLKQILLYLKPKSIITFADARYGTGKVYKKSGFNKVGLTNPNYHYYRPNDGVQRFSRNAFQKHKLKNKLELFDPNLTEWENMQLNGYDRIWDCGHYKYELII